MSERRGLPGGMILPALVLVGFAALFVIAWSDPDLIDFGPRISPAGVGVVGSAFSFFWLLAAIGTRRKP